MTPLSLRTFCAALALLAASQTPAFVQASPTSSRPQNLLERQSSQGYTDPRTNGGSMLTQLDPSTGLGEPLNVIISGNSDSSVLTPAGISEYFESLYFSPGSCAGISQGGPQLANLGDGRGYVNQTDVLRFNYYEGDGGTCLESLRGGNHLRYWMQNGSTANTGAVFIAASYELNASLSHNIVPDGYDLGRNYLVGNATNSSGTTSPGGFKYTATMNQVSLLQGISTSEINHNIGVDGNVDVLTIRVTKQGQMGANRENNGDANSGISGASSLLVDQRVQLWTLAALSFAALALTTTIV